MLTRKQHELLMFIHHHLETTGFSPSFDEMKDGLDLRSKSGVHRLITALEERGFLRRRAHRARALEVVRLPPQKMSSDIPHNSGHSLRSVNSLSEPFADSLSRKVPLLGNIAAGHPKEAIGETTSYIDVPTDILHSGPHYAVKVSGDSMSDAGILDGDIAIIRLGSTFDNGDIVVALVDKAEATLKKIRKRGNSIALEPCNPLYETKIFGADRVEVQGTLSGLIRSYRK
ncbi:transcriptional repressor LexA [Roseococcus sp. SDR]|uniref:transcriptional repressor LexA n=1 Tax=Roseococcus sp. SDR TaxID=2835532 RepID=UPI001BD14838|nr:transcriptional repressor LexA [Roseococcus sp. SDR]MBS7789453.1 transcriptional repressor LexA [Roseococcus sp. SDR]MBV1844767.1 transcriptional repressor LexA [Roseococcus sp. SDR]